MDAVKLATAKARLAKIEGDMPSDPFDREYIRYEDLPSLHSDDAKILKQKLIDLLTLSDAEMVRRRNDWYKK